MPAGVAPLERKEIVLILALGLIAALVCAASFDDALSTIGDNAEFIILARSILSGQGYRMINHPSLQPNTKYPPGFPAMLACWAMLFGDSIVGMKVFVVVTLVVASMIAYLVARRFLSKWLSFVSILMIVTSWNVIKYSFDTLSDVPYMLVSLLGLLLLLRIDDQRSLTCGSLIAIGSFMVRTVGLSLVIASWLWLLIKKRWKIAAISVLVFVVVAGAWTARNIMVSHSATRYTELFLLKNPYDQAEGRIDFQSLARRVGINLKEYTTYYIAYNVVPTLLEKLGGKASPGSRLLAALVLLISVLGIHSIGKKNPVIPIYLFLYVGIYLVWPEVWTGERFMLPISPIIAIGVLLGLVEIFEFFRLPKRIPLLVASLLVASNLLTLFPYMARQRGYPPGWRNYFEVAQWAKQNTPENSVFLCRSAFLFHVVSSRKTIGYPMTSNVEEIESYLLKTRPDYIVIENIVGTFSQTAIVLGPALAQMGDQIEIVYVTNEPRNILLKFSPKENMD